MTCASCVAHVEKALAKVAGVIAATVNLATEKVNVSYRSGIASVDAIEEAIRGAGYEPRRIEADDASIDREREARERELTEPRRSVMIEGRGTRMNYRHQRASRMPSSARKKKVTA